MTSVCKDIMIKNQRLWQNYYVVVKETLENCNGYFDGLDLGTSSNGLKHVILC